MRKIILTWCCLLIAFGVLAQTPITINQASVTRHGPEKGSLLIIGGNVGSTASVWAKFTELAGGKDKARIVVVTTGAGDSAATDLKDLDTVKKYTGVKNVVLLHTTSLTEANSEKFIAPLKQATGVYFVGGRQWHIADSYLNTLTHYNTIMGNGPAHVNGNREDFTAASGPFFLLSAGQRYDLKNRKVIQAPRRVTVSTK